MKKILIWVEPHPIRNSYVEFLAHGEFLVGSLMSENDDQYDFRLFSNDHVLSSLGASFPQARDRFIRPNPVESESMDRYFGRWESKRFDVWLQLVRGTGDVSSFYFDILARIHREFPFEFILHWSDNGAVRRFAKRRKLPTASCELGPTRSPFMPTFYIDPSGTNGQAAVRNVSERILADVDILPSEFWSSVSSFTSGADYLHETVAGGPAFDLLPEKKYAFFPVQLADDLNTTLNSDFSSPTDFLKVAIPAYKKRGYGIVVKGHPSAADRPNNLVEDVKALEFAKSCGAIVIDRRCQAAKMLNIVSKASIVVTVNSSSGFEAMLLGKKVELLGDAAFDIGGRLKRDTAEIRREHPFNYRHADRLTSFLLRHYLHPMNIPDARTAFRKAIDILFEHGTGDLDDNFWKKWIARFDHASDLIRNQIQQIDPSATFRELSALIAADSPSQACAMGHIDEVSHQDVDGMKEFRVRGWALEVPGKRRLKAVALLRDGNLTAAIGNLARREDVSKALDTPVLESGFTIKTIADNVEQLCLVTCSMDDRMQHFPVVCGGLSQMDMETRSPNEKRDPADGRPAVFTDERKPRASLMTRFARRLVRYC